MSDGIHPDSPVLSFERVARSFVTGKPVLRDVTFRIGREEIVALLGRNAAGKTTLLHLAMGLLHPERGTVRAFGVSPTAHPVEVKRRIGYVGEQSLCPLSYSIANVLDLHRALYPTWDRALERELLDRFELASHRGRIQALSNGQRQQLALLCAVSHRPELLVLDEPAAALDPVARREFLETSLRLLNRDGASVLFSSHHMGDVERLGGRALLLHDGAIVIDRPLDELREGHCVAVVPRPLFPDPAPLRAIDGVRNVRAVGHDWHVVVAQDARAAEARLRGALGTVQVHCTALPLEEFFIEMLGNPRETVAA